MENEIISQLEGYAKEGLFLRNNIVVSPEKIEFLEREGFLVIKGEPLVSPEPGKLSLRANVSWESPFRFGEVPDEVIIFIHFPEERDHFLQGLNAAQRFYAIAKRHNVRNGNHH